MKLRNMIIGALLTAMAIIFPIFPGSLVRVVIPPFSASIASHVPILLAMFISPATAVLVAAGSAIGFLFTGLGPVVIARAATHVIFAFAGAYMLKKGVNMYLVLFLTMFIHGFSEALVVIPFGLAKVSVLVGIGTMLHHVVDSMITIIVYFSLVKAGVFKKTNLSKKMITI